jgi:hypothetical protein
MSQNVPFQLLKHNSCQLSCSFGVQPQSFANVRSRIIARLRCKIMQDMVGDIEEVTSALFVQYPAPLFLESGSPPDDCISSPIGAEILACARCLDHRRTTSEDAIWTIE